MNRLYWQRHWYDLVVPPVIVLITSIFTEEMALRLLGAALVLATVILLEYIYRQRINAGYLLLVVFLPIAVLIGWVHPVLPWLLFAAVMAVGFVFGPALWAVQNSWTEPFFARYEVTARANLLSKIRQLR